MFRLGLINFKRYIKNIRTVLILIIISSTTWLIMNSISSGSVRVFSNLVDDNILVKQIKISYGYFEENDYKSDYLNEEDLLRVYNLANVKSLYNRYELIGQDSTLNLNDIRINFNTNLYVSYAKFNQFNDYYKELFDIENEIVYGSKLKDDGIIISELALFNAGIKDFGSIVGQYVLLRVGNQTINVRIDGIYNAFLGEDAFYEDYFNTTIILEQLKDINMLCPCIIGMDVFNALNVNNSFEMHQTEIIALVDNVSNVVKVTEELKELFLNELFSDVEQAMNLMKKISDFTKLVNVLTLIVLIQVALLLICAIITKIYNQQKYLKILITLGYRKINIIKAYLIDYSFILILGILISVVLSFILTLGIDSIFKPVYIEMSLVKSNAFMLNSKVLFQYLGLIFISYYTLLIIFILTFVHKYEKGLKDENIN